MEKRARERSTSYEFADSAKRFLLDAKRTKNVNARQAIRELVLLPSSLASGEAKHFLPPVPAMPAGQLGPPAAFSTGQRARGRTDAIYHLGGGP